MVGADAGDGRVDDGGGGAAAGCDDDGAAAAVDGDGGCVDYGIGVAVRSTDAEPVGFDVGPAAVMMTLRGFLTYPNRQR